MTRFGLVKPNENVTTHTRLVASGTTASIDRGAPCKEGSNGATAIMVDGDGTTSQRFSGIAKSVSTETASASGRVELIVPLPGLLYVGSPKVVGAANTQAEIDALYGKRVVFDLTSTVWTIDTAAVDAIGNGVVIAGGVAADDVVYFFVTHTVVNFFEDN